MGGYNPHIDAMVCCAYTVSSWAFKRGIFLFVTGEKKRRLVLEDGGGSLAKEWVGFIGDSHGFLIGGVGEAAGGLLFRYWKRKFARGRSLGAFSLNP